MSRHVVVTSGNPPFGQGISIGPHQLIADEPMQSGGNDNGPNPYELLLGALGACTGMTLEMYAARKQWPLKSLVVSLTHEKVYAKDCAGGDGKEATLDLIKREIVFIGELTDEQRRRLLEVADRCPVHRTLTSGVRIETSAPQFDTPTYGH
jgi:putative redox protein